MTTTTKILRYEFNDVVRGKGVLIYALFFFLLTEALIRFSGGAKALISLMNVALILIPLVSILFGVMYLYNAREFITMLLVQPISRFTMYGGLYLGLSIPIATAFLLGVGLPFILHGPEMVQHAPGLRMILLCGVFLTFIFVALSFVIFVFVDDRVRGFSTALFAWFFSIVIYDGIILFLVNAYQAYPLEIPTLILIVLNPVDLARILLMLSFDVSAMMGYTGAVFEAFFGSPVGLSIAVASLLVWIGIPVWLSRRYFFRKDF